MSSVLFHKYWFYSDKFLKNITRWQWFPWIINHIWPYLIYRKLRVIHNLDISLHTQTFFTFSFFFFPCREHIRWRIQPVIEQKWSMSDVDIFFKEIEDLFRTELKCWSIVDSCDISFSCRWVDVNKSSLDRLRQNWLQLIRMKFLVWSIQNDMPIYIHHFLKNFFYIVLHLS